jgi:NADH dehydrogenase
VSWITIADVLSQTGRHRGLKGMTDHNTNTKVVVIGGGYAGTLAANRLGAGDAVVSSAQPLRMCCAAAGSTAAAAADTVLSRIAGVRAARFGLAYVGSKVGLGRRAARFQFTRRDDTPVNVYFGGRIGGRIAASIKEAVAKGTLWGIRREARKPGSTRWPKGGPRPEQPVLEPEAATNP